MPERLLIRPAAIKGQPGRVALYLSGDAVAHACTTEAAQHFARGWAARLELRRRLPPVSAVAQDREQWLRGWDKANDRERRAGAA